MTHALTVVTDRVDVIHLECSCGWGMPRPGAESERYAPWSVREIVDISNSHLTAATS